jgi:hypothetical protein
MREGLRPSGRAVNGNVRSPQWRTHGSSTMPAMSKCNQQRNEQKDNLRRRPCADSSGSACSLGQSEASESRFDRFEQTAQTILIRNSAHPCSTESALGKMAEAESDGVKDPCEKKERQKNDHDC